MDADLYLPAAPSTVGCSGRDLVCPDCQKPAFNLYGLMGTDEPLRCGRCHDDHFYAGKPEARAAAEAHRNDVIRWLTTGATP